MKRDDVRAYGMDVAGKKKILYVIPEKIDETWVWYDRYNGYGKAATSKDEAKNIVENEILPNCKTT